MRMMEEFDLIRRFFKPLARAGRGVNPLGLADDAAMIAPHAGFQLVVSADAYASGVHFRKQDPPDLVGEKILAAAISDLAAKAARPLAYFLSAAFARGVEAGWIEHFTQGLQRGQAHYGFFLAGGDSISLAGAAHMFALTVIGEVKQDAMPRRAGMKQGDLIFISGSLGDAALGLRALRGGLPRAPAQARKTLIRRYQCPSARLALGLQLGDAVSAMMDVSDGLAADLGHMVAASKVGAVVQAASLPLSPAALGCGLSPAMLRRAALTGGDDYELLFAAPPAREKAVRAAAKRAKTPIVCIGRAAGKNPVIVGENGKEILLSRTGWQHRLTR